MATNNNVLVLGATGGIGGEVARQLRDTGWQVRALKRGAAKSGERKDGITWLSGDALNRQDVLEAAQGCSVIVHAVNPPGYRRWSEWVLPMLDNTIAAAIAEGATIVLPGTVYNFGPDAFPVVTENSPQHPATRKGAIRVKLEQHLFEASRRGARVLIVRAGDFFGPKTGSSWFSQGLVKPAKPVKTVSYPGGRGIGHQWSYLPDVARTMVELLARRETLDAFASFHMADHWDADGAQMSAAIRRAEAAHDVVSQMKTPPRALDWTAWEERYANCSALGEVWTASSVSAIRQHSCIRVGLRLQGQDYVIAIGGDSKSLMFRS